MIKRRRGVCKEEVKMPKLPRMMTSKDRTRYPRDLWAIMIMRDNQHSSNNSRLSISQLSRLPSNYILPTQHDPRHPCPAPPCHTTAPPTNLRAGPHPPQPRPTTAAARATAPAIAAAWSARPATGPAILAMCHHLMPTRLNSNSSNINNNSNKCTNSSNSVRDSNNK